MKIKAIVLSSLLVIGVIAGCSSGDSSSKTEATTTTTSIARQTTTTTYSLLDGYVDAAKTQLPNATRKELIEVGEQSCTVIRAYGSVELAILGIAADPDWTSEMAEAAGFIMGAAIPVFCPEYTAELKRIIA